MLIDLPCQANQCQAENQAENLADLAKFSAGWDDHPLRTEGFLSPNQLREIGMLRHPIRGPEMSEENVAVEEQLFSLLYLFFSFMS